MKKISVLVLALVFVFAVCSLASAQNFMEDGQFVVKMGMDFNGEMSGDGADENVDSAMTISGEYLVPYQNDMELGVGLSYQMERKLTDMEEFKFNFTPVYGVAKMSTEMGNYSPYFMGQVGYNLFNVDIDGEGDVDTENGLYYGFGAGMEISENLNAEVLYSVNNGKIEGDEVEYSSIRAGVSFAF